MTTEEHEVERDPELDRRLVGWISAGPKQAPAEVVERALVETTTIVQLPRQDGASVIRSVVIGTALAAILLVVAVALGVLLFGG